MNILMLTNTMKQPDDTFKGKTDLVFYFAKAWAKSGHNVVVIHSESKFPLALYRLPECVYSFAFKNKTFYLPSEKSRHPLERSQDGVKIVRLPMLKLIPHACFTDIQYRNQIKKINSYLKKISFIPDIITGHWLEPQLKLIYLLGKQYGAKTGFVMHGDLPIRLKNTYKEYLQSLDCFFVRSNAAKKRVINNSDFRLPKISVCYSGVPDEYVKNMRERDNWLEQGTLHLISVGRLVSYKRFDAVLNALAQEDLQLNFEYDIVGDGPELPELEQLATSLQISDKVHFHGRVDRDTVQRLMSHADCFVLISENEVFGLVYLEAMTAGCITIASIDGGVDGIIIDGENGFLCKQGDATDLKNILKKLYCMDYTDIKTIKKNAHTTVQQFTDSKVANRYLNDITNV